MALDTAAFRLDDSPIKLDWASMKNALDVEEDAVHFMIAEPLSSVQIDALDADSLDAQQDPNVRVLCMKKAGHGSKPFKSWLNGLTSEEGVEALKDYQLFKLCQPRVLVAGDVLESLEMRLCYHLHNSEGLQQAITAMDPKWEPFKSHPLAALSYKAMVWFHFRKEEATKKGLGGGWMGTQKAWLEYAMEYVELSYIDDLVRRGYNLAGSSREDVATVLRWEMASYLTCRKQPRNNAGHVFSTAIKQDEANTQTGRAPSRPKVRDLLDVPVPDLSEDSRKSLLDIIDHFFHSDKLPDHLKDLKWSFSMQLCFLRDVLQKVVVPSFGDDVGTTQLPPPIRFD